MIYGLGDLIDRLSIANIKISILESKLRQGEKISNEEAGKLAKQIREINDKERVPVKNVLNNAFGKDFNDFKIIYD